MGTTLGCIETVVLRSWHAFWMTAPMFLSDQEVADMCAPLVSSAAQKRFLRSLGLTVNEKPNGRPLVVRSHAEAVLSGRADSAVAPDPPPTFVPDREAYIAKFTRRRSEALGPDRDALLQVIRERQAARPKRRAEK